MLDYFGDELNTFLFLPDGEPRFPLMDDLGFMLELHGYRLVLQEREYFGVTVKKFKLYPANGMLVDVTFSISFKPQGNVVATLAEFLDESIDIELAPADRELNFGAD